MTPTTSFRIRERLRSARDLGLIAPLRFRVQRRTAEHQQVFDVVNPLVSICVATYNRVELLRERSLESLLTQTYDNIEIIVVGDGCTDATAQMMAGVTDERVKFENLAERGIYPEDPHLRWMVAGTAAVNRALELASGDFITHLDDDDEHMPDRVEKLVKLIQGSRADLVYHPFVYETSGGEWLPNTAEGFRLGKVTTSSILYHKAFRTLGWDPYAYRYAEPGDWNRLRKIKYLGARSVRHPEALLKHYKERSQPSEAGRALP